MNKNKHESDQYLGTNKLLHRIGNEICSMCGKKLNFFTAWDIRTHYEINKVEFHEIGGTDFTYDHINKIENTMKKICIQCYNKLFKDE